MVTVLTWIAGGFIAVLVLALGLLGLLSFGVANVLSAHDEGKD